VVQKFKFGHSRIIFLPQFFLIYYIFDILPKIKTIWAEGGLKSCFMSKIFNALVLLAISASSFSQHFMHSAGVSTYFENVKNGDAVFNAGLLYSPRYNFIEKEHLSLSLGTPIGIGLALLTLTNGMDRSSKTGVVLDLPFMLDLNIGGGSVPGKTEEFGFFIGGGIILSAFPKAAGYFPSVFLTGKAVHLPKQPVLA
jgi:hypothetical protein